MSLYTMPQPSPTYNDNRYGSYPSHAQQYHHTHHVHQNQHQQSQQLVDRLTQPSTRQKKTIYVHPFNSQNYADFVPIAIRSDVSSLHKVLDMIQRVKGAKLHSRVVGLYHYQDRSRIYSVNDIVNGEHVIFVCHGEVHAATSYASSQSSEGSSRQPRQQRIRGQVKRDNSFEGLARNRSSSPILQLSSSGSAPTASFALYQPHSRKSISSEDVTKPSKLPSNLAKAKRILSTPQSLEVQQYGVEPTQPAVESNGVTRKSLQHVPSSGQSVASDQISLAAGISTFRDKNSSKGNVQRFLEDPQNELFPQMMRTSKPVQMEEDVDRVLRDVDRERSTSFSFDIPTHEFTASKSKRHSSSSQDTEKNGQEMQIEVGGKNLTAAEILQQEPLYSEISLDIGMANSPSQVSQQTSFEMDEEDVDMSSPFQDSKMPVIHETEEEENSASANILSGLSMKNLFRQMSGNRSKSQGTVKTISAGERIHSYDDIDFKTNRQIPVIGPSFLSDPDSSRELDPHSGGSSSLRESDSDLPQILMVQRQEQDDNTNNIIMPRRLESNNSVAKKAESTNKDSVSDSNSVSQAQSQMQMINKKKRRRAKSTLCLCLYPPDVIEN